MEFCTNHSKDDKNQENIKTPDAPRLPEKILTAKLEPTAALSENKKLPPKIPVHENETLASTEKDLGKIDNGLNRVLQRKAGMNILRSSSFPRSTEYQRQYVWRTPQKISPILAADQVIHRASKSIPPYKSPAIIPETEYERCFKPPSVKELRETNNLQQKECPVLDLVESSPGKKKEKKESLLKAPEDPAKENKSEAEQKQRHKEKYKPLCLHRRFRKMNTEYRSKFLSPTQYIYKDGAWLRIRRNVPDQGSRNTLNYMWYMEVKELREKAEAYRKRIQGTHFSRDHLNQILSDNNRLWDLSSASSAEESISNNVRALDLAGVSEKQISLAPKTSPQPELSEQLTKNNTEKLGLSDATTVADKRRIAWGEVDAEKQENLPLEEGEEKENKQEPEGFEKGSDKDGNTNNQQEGNVSLGSSSSDQSDSASLSSGKHGRLPTPQLRVLGGAQRTHHDLTTPATGGAVLVSPPKVKPSSSVQVKKEESREDTKRKSHRDEVEATMQTPFSAAGLKTQDHLPLRKDQWPDVRSASATVRSEHTPIIPTLKPAKDSASSYWSPSCRIQGTLRDPEFQHNGNVASPQRSWLQLPLQERNYHDEDDDKLSQLSARSAASSSLASQVLERAQRRKENFWGKM